MDGPSAPICNVCGERCLVVPGIFRLGLRDPTTNAEIAGTCCSVCVPRVNDFVASEYSDASKLPSGPLRAYLNRIGQVCAALRCLEIIGWLAEHHATIEFGATQKGGPVDFVKIDVPGEDAITTATGPALEPTVRQLMSIEAARG